MPKEPNATKSFIIVFYEEIPEKSDIMVIPSEEIDSTIRAAFDKMNGKFVRPGAKYDIKAAELMFDLVASKAEYCSGHNPKYNCRFAKYRTEDLPVPQNTHFMVEKIYNFGMVL